LVFVNVHPFNDGNGKAVKLFEKWFLAQNLGEVDWYIQSEKYDYFTIDNYYKNLNKLGMFYEKWDCAKAYSFHQLLPNAIHCK